MEFCKDAYLIALLGSPWSGESSTHVIGHATHLLLAVLSELKTKFHWRLIASADMFGSFEKRINIQGLDATAVTQCCPIGTDSWFFVSF